MLNKFSPRAIFALIGFICVAVLIEAWYLQYGPGRQQPCPLCVMQRYLYMALAAVSLLAAAHVPARVGLLVYASIADLLATCGIGFALWQVNKGASMTSCMDDPVGVFINGLPSANWWPEFLFANGGCADVYPPILGLHVPQWSLICFTVLALMSSATLIATVRDPRNA